jgi:NADPH:quinone reductase-like Zn-dependent oxidoreductase
MNAVFFSRHGGPEVLQYGTIPDPVPGPADVIVGVKACALNHLDIWVRNGLPVVAPMPHIPGSDVSGIVLETGKDAKGVKKGDRVVVSPGQLAPEHAASFEGRDSYSPDFQILGLQRQGGYAEKVVVNARHVLPASERFTFEEWAALPLASLTAYHMLVTRAQLQAGETVLIHAGGSGIGSFALQIARHLGARVLTTVGDKAKAERTRSLGADEVILYKEEDFAERARELTGGQGVDVVFEHIGPEVWEKSLACLGRGGRLVTCGATSGAKVEMDLRPFYSKQLSVLGSYMGSLAELKNALALAEKGVIKPVIDQVFPLKDAAEAHRRMESRRNFGKIVLRA